MTVEQLILRLQKLPPDKQVWTFGINADGKFDARPVGFAEEGEVRTVNERRDIVFLHTFVTRRG